MNDLSSETRRLLDAARMGDEPTAEGERSVREGLTTRLGIAALTGVAGASATLGAAKTVSAAGAAGLASGAQAGATIGSSASAMSASALTKTLAGLFLVAGLGTSAWRPGAFDERAITWVAPIEARVERAIKKAWSFVTNDVSSETPSVASTASKVDEAWPSDTRRHELLIAIARRPDHPIAKEAELVLILGADKALTEGDRERARRYLDEHQARFARGALLADREALRALVESSPAASPKVRAPNF